MGSGNPPLTTSSGAMLTSMPQMFGINYLMYGNVRCNPSNSSGIFSDICGQLRFIVCLFSTSQLNKQLATALALRWRCQQIMSENSANFELPVIFLVFKLSYVMA